jgi:hypothetical protein
VTDLPASGIRAPAVARRDELPIAVMEASRAYGEARAFRGLFSAPSSLRSTYRPSEHPVNLPAGFA